MQLNKLLIFSEVQPLLLNIKGLSCKSWGGAYESDCMTSGAQELALLGF